MSRFIHKTHNVSILLYHFVCPTKYRRSVLTESVEAALVSSCLGISEVYEIDFLEIGCDKNHVHFLVQSVPTYSPTKIVRTIKSITARELFSQIPTLKKQLWGGSFWSTGFYVSSVGRFGDESSTRRYIANQGLPDYKPLHEGQLTMFDGEIAS